LFWKKSFLKRRFFYGTQGKFGISNPCLTLHKIPIGGMHIVYLAVGMVEADGTDFRFVPGK
jgi:hypothetical protein